MKLRMIWDYQDYKKFVKKWVRAQNRKGYGQYNRMAAALKTTRTTISQVFNGNRDLQVEQALALARFMNLAQLEEKYLVAMVGFARAATPGLREFFLGQMQDIKIQSENIAQRIQRTQPVQQVTSLFYSDWACAAIRQAVAIDGIDNPAQLSGLLKLDISRVQRICDLLLENGLIKLSNGRYEIGPKSTHVNRADPLAQNHHRNWRHRALESLLNQNDDDLFYTAPASMSLSDYRWLKDSLLQLVVQLTERATGSEPEIVAAFNFDCFVIAGLSSYGK